MKLIKDRNGDVIKLGDRFRYQIGTPYEIIGKVIKKGRSYYFHWEEYADPSIKNYYPVGCDDLISKTWYASLDRGITELIKE